MNKSESYEQSQDNNDENHINYDSDIVSDDSFEDDASLSSYSTESSLGINENNTMYHWDEVPLSEDIELIDDNTSEKNFESHNEFLSKRMQNLCSQLFPSARPNIDLLEDKILKLNKNEVYELKELSTLEDIVASSNLQYEDFKRVFTRLQLAIEDYELGDSNTPFSWPTIKKEFFNKNLYMNNSSKVIE